MEDTTKYFKKGELIRTLREVNTEIRKERRHLREVSTFLKRRKEEKVLHKKDLLLSIIEEGEVKGVGKQKEELRERLIDFNLLTIEKEEERQQKEDNLKDLIEVQFLLKEDIKNLDLL